MASSDIFNIKINVKGGHAAHPNKTADSIVIAAYIMLGLQAIVSRELKPTDNAVITIGKMTAGSARNIIPSEVVLEGTFRCLTPEVRTHISESIERISVMTAQAHCATAEVKFKANGFPLINDDAMNDLVEKAAKIFLGEKNCLNVPLASMSSIIFIASIVMGSGNAPFFAFSSFAPDVAKQVGSSAVNFLLPMQLSASVARSMYL